jgi:hypothetical protein
VEATVGPRGGFGAVRKHQWVLGGGLELCGSNSGF